MAVHYFLALDLGASSGRAMLGSFQGDRLEVREVHRFVNQPVEMGGTLYWDFPRLFHEVSEGIRQGINHTEGNLAGVGIDTWGVDFGLLNKSGRLLANPVHYRDKRNLGVMEKVFEKIPREELFSRTGLQFLPFNTLFQLAAMKEQGWPELETAATLLMMPDLFNYVLCGEKRAELTIASTTQFLNPWTREWDRELLEKLDLPSSLLPELVNSGTVLGQLEPRKYGLEKRAEVPVIATAGHDTAAAVAAVPVATEKSEKTWAYLSSGTWSLMGMEINAPIINELALKHNFTNEGGVEGRIRFLKNISGLWLVQECRRVWAREEGREISYAELTELARQAPPFLAFIDPDHPSFLLPENMPAAICNFCERTGQKAPADQGSIMRCVLTSLALKYWEVKEKMEEVTGKRIDLLHVVGGGSQDELLNQLTAEALGLTVLAGPVEATALGNLVVQAMAKGVIPNLAAGREMIRRSFPLLAYQPREDKGWAEAKERFQECVERGAQFSE